MPIYAYKCSACGHAQDVMQKIADAPLTVCLACGAPSFSKQITAAGFQLKGNGWYATDFKNGSTDRKSAADKTDSGKAEAGKAATAGAATATASSSATAHACGSGGCGSCS